MNLKLVIADPDPNDPLGGFRNHLVNIERDITKNDLASLKSRHQSGTWMLRLRGDAKRLPNAAVAALIEALGVSAAEITNRMKLAEKYQVAELPNALGSFGSWYGICQNGLYEKRTPTGKATKTERNTVPLATSVRTWRKALGARTGTRLTDSDRRELRQLAEMIAGLLKGTD